MFPGGFLPLEEGDDRAEPDGGAAAPRLAPAFPPE